MSEKVNIRAIISGFFAGSASCFAKLALAPDSYIPQRAHDACLHYRSAVASDDLEMDYLCLGVGLLPRALFLIFMVVLNLIMVATFLDGMNESGSVIATALAAGTNFSISAMYGIVLFQEEVNLLWFCGFAMILSGVCLLLSVNMKEVK
mmetsp:Transcript_6200/g.7221  ORF Transcript_6200/g.7221 Transcript_6200/m.7221 type:complete len:149 (+) Transcript_6200:107-553(+)